MPLILCPDCGRQISTAAEACPQCGRPNEIVLPKSGQADELKCHCCHRPATQRCPQCGVFSCPAHLLPAGRSVVCLRCQEKNQTYAWVAGIIAIVIIVGALASNGLATRNDPRKPKLKGPPIHIPFDKILQDKN